MPQPNRENRGRTVEAAALILTKSAACPIPAGASGHWLDANNNLKLRAAGGSDTTIARGISAVLLARAKTAAPLPASTYDNGTLGVGATLTANANGALGAQGSVALGANDYVLVDQQVAGAQNGLYQESQPGDGGSKWVLTRAPEFDEAGEIRDGVLVVVQEGDFAGRIYEMTSNGPIVVGTTPLTFAEPSNVMLLDAAQLVTGLKRFADAKLKQMNAGGSAGHTLASVATADRIWTLPDETGIAASQAFVAAAGIRKITQTIAFGDVAIAALTKAVNLGAALPAGAYVLHATYRSLTAFSGGGATLVKLDIGGTDTQGIGKADTIFTGAATKRLVVSGNMPMGIYSAEQLVATFTSDVNLNTLVAGSVTIDVLYAIPIAQ